MPSNKFWLVGLAVAAAKEAPTAANALDSKELAGKPLLEKVETSLAAVKPTAQFQPAKEILGVKPALTMMGDFEGAKVGVKMRVEYKARDGKAAEMTWLAVSKAFVKMAGVDPSRVTVALTVGGGVAGAPNNRRLAIPASDEKLFHADLPAYLTKNRAEYAEYFAYAARSASGLVVG